MLPFSPQFRATNVAALYGSSASLWYLSGGITSEQCVAAYQPKGAASLAASYSNLNNPGTNDAAPGVAPTLSSGWSFNGSTQYLTTGIVPVYGYSVAVQYTNSPSNRLFGCVGNSSVRFEMNASFYGYDGTYAFGTGGANQILTKAKCYANGALDVTLSTSSGTWANGMFIGARNNSGTADFFTSGTIVALAVYNITLSDSQASALATAMAAL